MAALAKLKPYLPGPRDLHVYGGGLLVAIGAWWVWPPVGLIFAGILLLYLGLRVPAKIKPQKPERGSA